MNGQERKGRGEEGEEVTSLEFLLLFMSSVKLGKKPTSLFFWIRSLVPYHFPDAVDFRQLPHSGPAYLFLKEQFPLLTHLFLVLAGCSPETF